MTLAEVLTKGEKYLETANVAEAKLNAWYLFSFCFDVDRNQFFLNSNERADVDRMVRFEDLLARRAKHIPLEYLTNETEFMGLPFYVDEHVLIPRQDTECLVEEVLKRASHAKVLDMCTGSGCIGISLAVLGETVDVTLADLSEEALQVAAKNATLNQVDIHIQQSDLFEHIEDTYDIIVSNPPYIPSQDIEELMPEVRDHEPRMALDGTEDGLLFYRSIIRESGRFLKEKGWLFFEIGYDQGEAVRDLMCDVGFTQVEIKKDLAGLDRIVQGQKEDKHV